MKKKSVMHITAFLIISITMIITTNFVSASASITAPSAESRIHVFEPGKVIENNFKISGDTYLDAYVKGYLANYTELIDPNPKGEARSIKTIITLPEDLPGGKNLLYVGVIESAPEGVMMGGRAAAQMLIQVINLFPYPVIESKLEVKDTNTETNTEAFVKVKSLSKNPINNIYSEIRVVDYYNQSKEYFKIKTNSISLTSLEEKSIQAILPTSSLERGVYRAIAKTHYGPSQEDVQESKTTFKVGDNDVSLIKYTKELEVDKINKATFTIRNEWNEEINGYVELYLNNKLEGTSATQSIKEFQENSFQIYIDTNNFELGMKDAVLKTYFNKKAKEFPIKFNITEESLPETTIIEKETPLEKYKWLIIANILIILLIIINLLVLMRKKK